MTKKKKAKTAMTKKKSSKKAALATAKTTKKGKVKMTKATAKKASAKPTKKKSAAKSSSKASTSQFDDMGIWALTSPDQPVDYDILVADSRSELVALVKGQLYVQPDGSAWVPQGSAFEEDEHWYQTMVKFD